MPSTTRRELLRGALAGLTTGALLHPSANSAATASGEPLAAGTQNAASSRPSAPVDYELLNAPIEQRAAALPRCSAG